MIAVFLALVFAYAVLIILAQGVGDPFEQSVMVGRGER